MAGHPEFNGKFEKLQIALFNYLAFKSINNMQVKFTYIWSDGKKYTGEWLNNKMHGHGHLIWPDGKEYIGEFAEDKRHGNGKFKWKDGREYNGQWLKGK